MNRQLKFRAWDGVRMTTSGIMFNNSNGCIEVPKEASFGGILTTKYEVMQFTGLTDKNGEQVFEGDIVQAYRSGQKFKGDIYLIKYDERQFIMASTIDETNIDCIWFFDFEIIGNIYENSNLLK